MILFRADASASTGFGHLTRSAYLAALLGGRAAVRFCVNDDKAARRFLEDRGLPALTPRELAGADLGDLRAAVFDLRHFGRDELALLDETRRRGARLVQVTDLGLAQQEVDLVVDGALARVVPYEERPGRAMLLGPEYMILHHKVRHFRKAPRRWRPALRRVFVQLGGGADYRLLRELVDGLQRRRLLVKTALGYSLKKAHRKALRRLFPGLRTAGPCESLARSFYEADLAVITPGVAAYEAAACGTPALYLWRDDLQRATAEAFAAAGAGMALAPLADLAAVDLSEALAGLTAEKRQAMGEAGRRVVDGLGAPRLVEYFSRAGIL